MSASSPPTTERPGTNKGKRIKHVNPLPKGQSCTSCFKRKVRCSGERPACAACLRNAKFQKKNPSTIECDYSQSLMAPRRRSVGKKSQAAANEASTSQDAIKVEDDPVPDPSPQPNLLAPLPSDPLESIFGLFPDIYGDGDPSNWDSFSSKLSSTAASPRQSSSHSLSDLNLRLLRIESSASTSTSPVSPPSVDPSFSLPDVSANPVPENPLLFEPTNDPNLFDESFERALPSATAEQPEDLQLRPEIVYETEVQEGSLGEYGWARTILEGTSSTLTPNQI